jgi:DNA mismatch endonuclease (patch repair protein)
MTDIVDPSKRSRIMASIRGKDTKPELLVRRGLHKFGARFRLHRRDLPGKPDLVFPRYRVVLFVHGCFWHRHAGCKLAYRPATNEKFWAEKFQLNIDRDRRQTELLIQAGWRVFVIWECSLRNNDLTPLFSSVFSELQSGEALYQEWPINKK